MALTLAYVNEGLCSADLSPTTFVVQLDKRQVDLVRELQVRLHYPEPYPGGPRADVVVTASPRG